MVQKPYVPHVVNKEQKIADALAALTSQSLVVSKLFTRESIDQFKGVEGDKITRRVPGRLPYRRYKFRNDRTNPLIYDVYKEGKVDVTMGDHLYSGVQLTDEQRDFDLVNWAKLMPVQAEAVARGVEAEAIKQLESAPFEVTIGGAEGNLRSAVLEARKVLNAFRVADNSRFLMVGRDFEQALLEDEKIVWAQHSGDAVADRALTEATIGRLAGFNVITDQSIAPDAAYAFVGSGFYLLNGAPSIPASVKHGSTSSVDGVALRWMTDYDADYLVDRSIVDCWTGSGIVKDRLLPAVVYGGDAATPENLVTEALEASTSQHFLRGLKLTLGGVSKYPEAGSNVALETGISATKAWTATVGG